MTCCKKCGNTVRDNACFCPKCGTKIQNPASKQDSFPNFVSGGFQTDYNSPIGHKKAGWNVAQKRNLMIAISVLMGVVLLVIGIRVLGNGKDNEKENEKYSLIGTWYSEDTVNLEKGIREVLEDKAGLSNGMIDAVMELSGLDYLGDIAITFTESGGMRFSASKVSFEVGKFSYEDIGNNTMLLKYGLQVPVVGDISIAYEAKYTLKKDSLTLDLFGVETKFRRK